MATKRLSDGSSIKNSFKLSRGATSVAKPEAPTIGTATKTGATTATLTFTAPIYGGSTTITNYTATSRRIIDGLIATIRGDSKQEY